LGAVDDADPPADMRLLVIDDDLELCELVNRFLASEGFVVDAVHNGAAGIARALGGSYALVLLDVMLGRTNGFDVLRQIRATSQIPIVMLTAKGDALDRVVGLEIGADDYLPKPFNPQELAARIRAVLRRSVSSRNAQKRARIVVDDVDLDPGARSVRRGGQPIELTTVEFDLLDALAGDPGQVISRESLVKRVLGREFSPFDRSIDTHVYNLRRKLGPLADGGERIVGIRGIGYLYACSSKSSSPSG
jgi:two-component system response regulator CpxR